jgi:hypothetical protein
MQTVKQIEGCRTSADNKFMEIRLSTVDGGFIELQFPQSEIYPLISMASLSHTQLNLARGETHTTFLPLADADAAPDELSGQLLMTVQIVDHHGWLDFGLPLTVADKLSKRLADARDYKPPSSASH